MFCRPLKTRIQSRLGGRSNLAWSFISAIIFLLTSSALVAQTVLVGNQAIESNLDSNATGLAEAFPSTASASGQVGSINVFLDESSAATKIYVGIYADSSGRPGNRLTQGSSTQFAPGTWNKIAVTPVSITSGTSYWIAILGTTGGKPYFRDRSTTACHSQTSSQSNLTSLPSTWSTGTIWDTCYISAYAVSNTLPATVMIGNQVIESYLDKNPAGRAEAFPATANTTGAVGILALYLDPTSGSGPVTVGLYADNSGHPGTLLGQGNTAQPIAGTWNQIPISPSSITAGQRYWIAVLGTQATSPYFRDRETTVCRSETTPQTNLTSLPATWSTGAIWNTCYISAYGLPASGSPVLSISPSTLSFTATKGGSNPASASLDLRNTGTGTLSFTTSTDAPWLSVSPTSGTAPQTVQVSAAVGTLTAGTYTGHVTVTAGGAQGSPATETVTFNIVPFIPPSITATASPGPNGNGWNDTSVTVSFACVPGTYPLASCPAPIVVATEGASQPICGNAVDTTGVSTQACPTVSIDKAPPTITATVTPAPIEGINFGSATVTFTCSDALSGIDTCPPPVTVTTSGSNQIISGTATDKAGNSAPGSVTLNIQPILPPTITSSISPEPNADHWNNSNVTVTFTCAAGSYPIQTCPSPVVLSTEGATQAVPGTVLDTSGRSATVSAVVSLDKTPPTITATVSPTPLANGWNTTPVTVTFACSDTLSGVATCPGPKTVSSDGAYQTISGTAIDVAGNSSTPAQVTVNIDQTAPSILQFSAPSQLGPGQSGAATVSVTDNVGVASVVIQMNGSTIATLVAPPYSTTFTVPANAGSTVTLTAIASDAAGNAVSSTHGIQVVSSGVVTGQVLSDVTGLPFAGATVQVLGGDAVASATDGRYSIPSTNAHLFLSISAAANVAAGTPAMVTVEREVTLQTGVGTVPVDARMTPVAMPASIGASGGTLTNGSVAVSVPGGTVPSATNFHLTSLSQQGLPGLLPLGWSPVTAFDLRGDTPTGASFSASFTQLPSSAVLHLVRYDYDSHAWLMATPNLSASNGSLTTLVPSVGAFALVTADVGNTNIIIPGIGQPLAGVAVVTLPAGASSSGSLNPPSISPAGGTSAATLAVQSSVPLPSGTVIQAGVQETYSLTSGKRISPAKRVQDIILYQLAATGGAAAAATFPVTASRTFQPNAFSSGNVHLDILSGRESVRGQIGGNDAATVTGDDATLTVAAGSLSQNTAIAVAAETVDGFLPATPSLVPLSEYNLDFSGQTLNAPAQLSVAAGTTHPGDTIIVAQIQRPNGIPYLVVVSLAQVQGNNLITQAAPGFPGITQGGDYVFYKISSPIGYVSGTVSSSSGPVSAMVQTDGLPFVVYSSPSGSYVIPVLAGTVTLTASVPNTALVGSTSAQVVAGQTVSVSLTVTGMVEAATVSPSNGAVGIPLTAEINITAPDPINEASVTSTSVTLTQNASGSGVPVPIRFVFSTDGTRLSVFPVSALQPSTTYTLAASGIGTVLGGLVDVPTTSFTTQSIAPPNFKIEALTFTMPDQAGNVQISAPANSFPPGTTILIVDQTNGLVLSLTVGNDGSVFGQMPATIDDVLAVTVTAPDKTTANFTITKFVAPDGTTAIGSAGGKVAGPGNTAVIIPPGALTKGATFKLTPLDQTTFPVLPTWSGLNFGSGLRIDAPSMPTFKKEAKLAFPVPPNAPPNAFYYVYRRLTDQDGNPYFETIDHAFVQGTGADAQVVTASPPFCGYHNSYGNFNTAVSASSPAATVSTTRALDFLLMWDASQSDPNLPGIASPGLIVGLAQEQVPAVIGVSAATTRPAQGTVAISLDSNPAQIAIYDGVCPTFTLFDPQFGGGIRSLTASNGTVVLHASADEVNGIQANDATYSIYAGLERQYRNIGRLNFLFPPSTPPPPPPQVSIRLFTLDSNGHRVPASGILQTGTNLLIAFQSKLDVKAASIGNNQLTVEIPDTTHVGEVKDDKPEANLLSARVKDLYPLGTAGTYTISASVLDPISLTQISASKSILVVAAGGGNTSTKTCTAAAPPAPPTLGCVLPTVIDSLPTVNVTGVSPSVFPQITFDEPVTNVTTNNVVLADHTGTHVSARLVGIRLPSSIKPGQDAVANPVQPSDAITSLTIQPVNGLSFNETYTLTLNAGSTGACVQIKPDKTEVPIPQPSDTPYIVDLNKAPTGPLCLQEFPKPGEQTYQFTTFGPQDLGGTSSQYAVMTRPAVIGDYAYAGEWINTAVSGLGTFDVSDPSNPADLGVGITFTGRAIDAAGQDHSPVTGGGLIAMAAGMVGSLPTPANVFLYDVSSPTAPARVGAVSVTSSVLHGIALRLFMKDQYLYASTFQQGLQVIDLGQAIAEYAQVNASSPSQVGQALTNEGDGFAMDTITNTIPLPTTFGGTATMYDLKADNFVVSGGSTQTLLAATGQLPLVVADPAQVGSSAVLYPPSTGGTFNTNPVQPLLKTSPDGKTNYLLCSGRAVALGSVPYTDSSGNSTTKHVAVVVGFGGSGPASSATSCSAVSQLPALMVVDLSETYTPGSPLTAQAMGFLQLSTSPTDVAINGTTALIATGTSVLLVNLQNPEQPLIAGQITGNFGNWLALAGSNVLVSTGSGSSAGGIETADLTGNLARPRPDTGPCKNCEGQAGAPINLANGNVYVSQSDYSLPGLGGGLSLSRTWNSQWESSSPIEISGTFGHSWRSNFDERLEIPVGTVGTGTIKYWRSDGSVWYFQAPSSGGTYKVSSPRDEHASLQIGVSSSTITFQGGTTETFNDAGYPTALADRNGNQTTIGYDSSKRVASVTNAAGRVLSFDYTGASSQAQAIRDSVGTIATYNYDVNAHLTKVTYADGSSVNMTYDDSDLLLSVTDGQGKVLESHTYDGARRGLTSARANGADSITVDYTSTGQTVVTNSQSVATTYAHGRFGGRGVVTSVSGPGCDSCGGRNDSRFSYDGSGNRTATTDAVGRKTSFSYDTNGNVMSRSTPVGSSSVVWSYTYNNLSEVLAATDPMGNTTTNTYDSKGNLLSVTSPAPGNGVSASITKFAYDSLGELTKITDPLGHATSMTYTPAGLIQTITDAQGNVTTYGYDPRGNRTSVKDAVGSTTTFAYDSMNRLTTITYPDSTTTQFGYDYRGRRTSVTDQNIKTTTYAYDDADRLTSVKDTAGNTTQYRYDAENNLTAVTDANTHTTSFTYDALGRVTQTTFPSGLAESYGYDAVGNLASKSDRKQQTIRYSYDELNRLVAKTYPDSTAVNYTYDNDSRLNQVTDASGTYKFTFDNMGRLIATSTQYSFLPGRTFTNAYTYDSASNRIGFTDPEGGITAYAYDTLNRLQTLTPPVAFTTGAATNSFGFSYDALNRRTQMTRPNNVVTNYNYDNLSRLLSVLHQINGATIDGASYTLDAAGSRTAKTDNPTNITTNYGYDAIYQLLSATRGGTTKESYTYDAVGNRLTALGSSRWGYNVSNELVSTPNGNYTYDANGNTLTDAQGRIFTWDFENRLIQAVNPGVGTTTFRYDPFGRRIQKSGPLGTANYLYDGANLLEEVDQSGSVVARYTQGTGADEVLAQTRSATVNYYEADGLGSVTSLTSASGAVAATYSYDSFGQLSTSTGTVTNPLRYTGRELDLETGIYYYRARYYDPNAGRFLTEDPLALGGGDTNLYAYVFNSPNNLVDPAGLKGTNPISRYLDGLTRNGNFLANWLFESDGFLDAQHLQFHGHDFLFYGTNTPESRDMMNSAGGLYMQLLYKYKYKCKGSPQNNNFPTWAAYLTTTGDPSNTAFQVGAFSFDITDMGDGTVQYTMYNKAGWHSLLGGLNFGLGDHERKPPMPMHEMDQYGGNVYQMFQWRGKKPCGCE